MELMNKKVGRIGILMGGPSSEREISFKSGHAVCDALGAMNLDSVSIDIKSADIEQNKDIISKAKIDCAFIALHGKFGEDGSIQEILESLNIPYTGSGVASSRLSMNKVATRIILQIYGVNIPKGNVIEKDSFVFSNNVSEGMNFPLVVKPVSGGSSIGLTIADTKEELKKAIEVGFNYDDKVLIEEFIAGRELTVGILEDSALSVIEIVPRSRFFDFEAKYKSGETEYIIPAKLEEKIAKSVQEAAIKTHRLLGCFGCSRVDIILAKDNTPYVLELNSIPGLTATSLLPKAAKLAGIEFNQLCLKLINLAYEKEKIRSTK